MVASRIPTPRDPDQIGSSIGLQRPTGESMVLNGRHPGLKRVARYDFRRPSRFSKDHLRTLQSIHEQFARVLATSLSSSLRLNIRSTLASVEQTAFEDYADRLPNPTIIYVLRMSPLDGPVTLEMSVDPTRVILDRLCGGPGLGAGSQQHLTEIERSLLRPLGRQIGRALAEAWSPVIQLDPAVEDVLLNPRAARAVSPNDTVALLTFELAVGDVVDKLMICLPYHSLEPLMDQLSARVWSLDQSSPVSDATEESLRARLLNVPVNATVILGEVELSTSAVLSLREGDVLRLSTAAQSDLAMAIDGRQLFRCRPGQSAGHVAVQVERIVETPQFEL